MTSPIDAFFPTPKTLIEKMLRDVSLRKIKNILEPSAGKGDIVDEIQRRMKEDIETQWGWFKSERMADIDTIEINPDLRHVLGGKGYRVIHDDFLTLHTFKHYDLIIMNPPFDQGEKHLEKALEIQKDGGAIICILNAETIRKPNNLTRVRVCDTLKQYGASIEFLADEFRHAERKTNVEIALIKVIIPDVERDSIIVGDLKKSSPIRIINPGEPNELTEADYVQATITQFNFEVQAGLQLIRDFKAMKPYLALSNDTLSLIFSDEYSHSHYCPDENEYLSRVRAKYWDTLFLSKQFTSQFTKNLLETCQKDVDRLKDYDFNAFNIAEIKINLINKLTKATEDTIIKLFEEFSNKHHWYDEMSQNIHYYNGWRTNKAWVVGKKIIIPCNLYFEITSKRFFEWSGPLAEMADIEKTMNYLSNKPKPETPMVDALRSAHTANKTKNIDTHYFNITCYKKGTVHITFKDDELLKKFNIFGAQHKGWLPPSYGKVTYDNLEPEEQEVVDSFEGEESYNETMANSGYYISGVNLLEMTN